MNGEAREEMVSFVSMKRRGKGREGKEGEEEARKEKEDGGAGRDSV